MSQGGQSAKEIMDRFHEREREELMKPRVKVEVVNALFDQFVANETAAVEEFEDVEMGQGPVGQGSYSFASGVSSAGFRYMAFSLCSPKDDFLAVKGLAIALGRLANGRCYSVLDALEPAALIKSLGSSPSWVHKDPV